MSLSNVTIECFQVKFKLPQVFRLKSTYLELEGDQTVKATVKEQQIQSKISASYLHGVFGADETEISAEFDQEFLQLRKEATVQIVFAVFARQIEKFKHVSVFEYAPGIRFHFSPRR